MRPVSAIDPIAPLRLGDVPAFAREVDVVVAGLGIAGVCAAIAASEAGAEVVAYERAGAPGGTSALSGGLLYLGGGTRVQREAGFDDTPEAMEAFLRATLGEGADAEKIAVYARQSPGHLDWLEAHGVPFEGRFHHWHDREPPDTSGLVFSGGEDAAPFAGTIPVAPRGHHPAIPNAAGGLLMESLLASLQATPAQIISSARVTRLIVDGPRVVGAVVREEGAEVTVRARRGVVLCAGGFMFNQEMVRHWCPEALRCSYPVGTDNDDGDGIRLGAGAGGALDNMAAIECALPLTPPRDIARGILVDGKGDRFINEDTYQGRIGQQALMQRDGTVFMLCDEPNYKVHYYGMQLAWVCETVEALAGELGVPPANLRRTFEDYNRHAARGEDPAFGKAAEFCVPLTEPIGAYDLRVQTAIYAPFTMGGLLTDIDGRVLDPARSPVPGLFAAGRTTSGFGTSGYASGISLGEGSYFGRRAGEAVATEAVATEAGDGG